MNHCQLELPTAIILIYNVFAQSVVWLATMHVFSGDDVNQVCMGSKFMISEDVFAW